MSWLIGIIVALWLSKGARNVRAGKSGTASGRYFASRGGRGRR